MKIALIKLGSRVSISSQGTSGGTGETLSIIKILTTAGSSVDVYTKVLKNDAQPEDFALLNIEDTYKDINSKGYDCLIILNGNVNYFGGADDPSQTLNYWIINNFIGKVFYIMCDCNLILKQIWPSIEKKKWASNYKREDIEITRDDIVYISQAMFIPKVLDFTRKYINIKSAVYFPFEKFPLLTMKDYEFNESPKYDLIYGGTFRGGRREADMIKFYFGVDRNVCMFGKIELSNFNESKVKSLTPPVFEKSVPYNKYGDKMLDAIATVIIGDPIYKQWGDLAQRIYESIRIGNVVLIDTSYDFMRRVFRNPELVRFNYVSNRQDVEMKLRQLEDNDFRKRIIDLQRKDVELNIYDYCGSLIKILEEN